MLSDYPARGGRTGYAVGLDSVESVLEILLLLRAEGYDTGARDWQSADIERLLHRRQPFLRCGKVVVLLQPDRGGAYHDTTAEPHPDYVEIYRRLRDDEKIDALIHLGTHGTLEWLPGKALALSSECWPEKVLGPVPVIYPFIVNNPGEAVQATTTTAVSRTNTPRPPRTIARDPTGRPGTAGATPESGSRRSRNDQDGRKYFRPSPEPPIRTMEQRV